MSTGLNEMISAALDLSEEDRATLAGMLLRSLEQRAEIDPDIESAWAAEAERRWKEIESGNAKTISWNEVKAKLLRQ